MIDKQKVQAISADIDAALKAIAAKHGLAVQAQGGRYSENTYVFRGATFADLSAAGAETNPIYFREMKRFGSLYNLDVKDIGFKFKIGNDQYELAGMKTSKWVIVKKLTGAKLGYYKYRPDLALQLMGKTAAAFPYADQFSVRGK